MAERAKILTVPKAGDTNPKANIADALIGTQSLPAWPLSSIAAPVPQVSQIPGQSQISDRLAQIQARIPQPAPNVSAPAPTSDAAKAVSPALVSALTPPPPQAASSAIPQLQTQPAMAALDVAGQGNPMAQFAQMATQAGSQPNVSQPAVPQPATQAPASLPTTQPAPQTMQAQAKPMAQPAMAQPAAQQPLQQKKPYTAAQQAEMDANRIALG